MEVCLKIGALALIEKKKFSLKYKSREWENGIEQHVLTALLTHETQREEVPLLSVIRHGPVERSFFSHKVNGRFPCPLSEAGAGLTRTPSWNISHDAMPEKVWAGTGETHEASHLCFRMGFCPARRHLFSNSE